MQEEQLIDGLINKNEDAFRFLVDSLKDKVFNTYLSFLRNRHDAEELTQDVFVEVHKSIGKFRREASLSTWIYKIAINKSLEYSRKQKRKNDSVMDELAENQRAAPVLHEIVGLS